MSIKIRSLGIMSSAARGILITSGTNATPIVATVTALHRLKNGDRIAIAGVTTLTAMNGEWDLASVGATSATLVGSAGNGAFGGTAAVAVLCDKTPHMMRHSALLTVQDIGVAVIFIGTVVCEGADRVDATQFYNNPTAGGAETTGFKDMLLSGETAINAQTVVGGGALWVEVPMARYMTARCSAYTSGSVQAALAA